MSENAKLELRSVCLTQERRLLQGTLIKIKSNVKLNSDLTRNSFRTAGVSISEADKVRPDSAPNELQHLWKERDHFSLTAKRHIPLLTGRKQEVSIWM